MSTVTDSVRCPQCGSTEAFEEFNNRSYTTEMFCPQCGRSAHTDFCKNIQAVSRGKGVFHAVSSKRFGITGSFRMTIPLWKRNKDMQRWAASPRRRLSSLTFTHRVEGKWAEIDVLGKSKPKTKAFKHKARKPIEDRYLDWELEW